MDEILNDVDLDPTADFRASMDEGDARRNELMRKVRGTYGATRRDRDLAERVKELIEDLSESPQDETPAARAERLEGNVFVLIGETGAGKSTALRRLFRRHPDFPGYGDPHSGCKLVTISAPPVCNLAELGRETLACLGYTLRRSRVDAPEVWRIVREQLRAKPRLILHFDEIQHVVQTSGDASELQKIRNTFKGLLVDPFVPVGLIVSGTSDVATVMHPDKQVARRGVWYEFRALVPKADDTFVGMLVERLAPEACLSFDREHDPELVRRLMHAGIYQTGRVAEEIPNAVRFCLKEGKRTVLDREHFAGAFAWKTGNLGPWNPYVAQDYLRVDANRVLATFDPPPPPPEPKAKAKARRGRKGLKGARG